MATANTTRAWTVTFCKMGRPGDGKFVRTLADRSGGSFENVWREFKGEGSDYLLLEWKEI